MKNIIWHTPDEVAARLRVHPETLKNWRKTGLLRPARIGPKVSRYSSEQIDAFERSAAKKATPPIPECVN